MYNSSKKWVAECVVDHFIAMVDSVNKIDNVKTPDTWITIAEIMPLVDQELERRRIRAQKLKARADKRKTL